MQRQRYTVIGTKDGYNVKDFIMAYSETEAKLIYKRSRPEVEVTECYLTKVNDWHNEAQKEIGGVFSANQINVGRIIRDDEKEIIKKIEAKISKAEDEMKKDATYRMYSDGRVEKIDSKAPDIQEIAGMFLPEQIGVGSIFRRVDKKEENE